MDDEKIKELLDQPAVQALSEIKGPSLDDFAGELKEGTDSSSDDQVQEGKKVRIPASRLKTLTSKIGELESKLQESQGYKERLDALEQQIAHPRDELPDWWKEAFGEGEVSKKGYSTNQRVMREELKRALSDMQAEQNAAQQARAQRIQSIESSFDTQMDELEETLGRELTDNQKAEVMEVVEKYSPKDSEGKYEAFMSIEDAYDIWAGKKGDNSSKRAMAEIASVASQGDTQGVQTSNGPLQWGSWRDRFK